MKKYAGMILPMAALQSAGVSIFISFHFLSAGVRSADKAAIILAGMWVIGFAILAGLYGLPAIRKKIEITGRGPFLLLALGVISTTALLTTVSPIARGKDPSNWQTIEIEPLPANSEENAIITLVEIKIDGQPAALEEYGKAPGWRLTERGLESLPGEALPLMIQRRGAIESGVSLLFSKGPQHGAADVRLGWTVNQVDTRLDGAESLLEISFPAPQQAPWVAIHYAGLILGGSGLLLLVALFFLPSESLISIADRVERLSCSVTFWITAGFLVCYAGFYFHPVFLNTSNMMRLENNLPAIYPIGNDLHLIMDAAGSLAEGGSPYAGANKYPPLAAAMFTALLGLNIRDAFRVLSTANLFLFVFLTLGAPVFIAGKKVLKGFAWLVFAAGLFTYGFLFEVERGQFNLLAVGLALLGVILFHKVPRFQWLGFILFCAGVQLKIYPAIFVVFFTRDWRDWKRNLLRWSALGLANVALLAALGWEIFTRFISMMTNVVSGLGATDWPVSHSINGFVMFLGSQSIWAGQNARLLQAALYLVVIILTALCLWAAIRRGQTLDPYLILACTLAALTLPSLSNDYTLALLPGAAILFFSRQSMFFSVSVQRRPWGMRLALGICALAFSSTFFSYFVKPVALQNQFPALLVMLACAAYFSMRDHFSDDISRLERDVAGQETNPEG